jgi:predicted Zn-dependent protease
VPRSACKIRRGATALIVTIACCGSACRGRSESPTAPSDSSPLGLSGVVTESSAPTAVPGARVEVVDGVNQGRSVVAAGDGRYALTDLQPGAFSVRAVADGFEAEAHSVTLTSTATVDFALRRLSKDGPSPARWTLSGVIREQSGSRGVVAGARAEIGEGINRSRSATADAAGRYELSGLEPGTFSVKASADGFGTESRSVTLSANQTLDFALPRVGSPAPGLTARAVDALSSQPLAGVTVRLDGLGETTTGADGAFALPPAAPDTVAVTMTSSVAVERSTRLRASPAATLTLIPKSLDLPAFDQMFRKDGGVLHRWVSAPRVVIERRVLQFAGTSDQQYVATATVMSEAEANELVADLRWALPQLTGDAFSAFAEHRIETAAEGQLVSVVRPGVIFVARYQGLEQATAFWGYTRWAWNATGEVQVGVLMLDRAFETSGSLFRRTLRAHELGHALGYNHVHSSTSVMNASGRELPSLFDRDASRIAFQRRPLNQSPDVDPDPITANRVASSRLFWSEAK